MKLRSIVLLKERNEKKCLSSVFSLSKLRREDTYYKKNVYIRNSMEDKSEMHTCWNFEVSEVADK